MITQSLWKITFHRDKDRTRDLSYQLWWKFEHETEKKKKKKKKKKSLNFNQFHPINCIWPPNKAMYISTQTSFQHIKTSPSTEFKFLIIYTWKNCLKESRHTVVEIFCLPSVARIRHLYSVDSPAVVNFFLWTLDFIDAKTCKNYIQNQHISYTINTNTSKFQLT